MGKIYAEIDDQLATWLQAQPMFIVATAPLAGDGLVNASPKGGSGTFVVLGPRQVAYQDLTGSGAETIAHLRENGRIVLMFMSFGARAQIVRLHGSGRVLLPGSNEYSQLAPRFPEHPGERAIVLAEISRIADSCGWGVPRMEFVEERAGILHAWSAKKGPDGLVDYRTQKNTVSLDGLPALDPPRR